jgi:CRP-like cAMP-binding protein
LEDTIQNPEWPKLPFVKRQIMNNQSDKQSRIVNRIIDGSVTVDSVADFNNLLKTFPNDPWLHKFYADLLKREKSFYAAADAYGIAADLFIELEMPLQALTSKIFEWRILEPSNREDQDFHSSLRESRSKNSAVQNFLIKMKYPEMMAFMSTLTIRHFPAGSMLKRFGDEESDLYFVVYGALEKTVYHRLEKGGKVHKKSTKTLVENDFFGEIYPFEDEKVSRSDIETITRVEFAMIPKSRLMAICREYPNVKILVDGLYKSRSVSDEEKFTSIIRNTVRHQLPTQVNIKIFGDEQIKAPMEFSGFTENISLGGASVVLGVNYDTDYFGNLVGKKVQIQINLPIAFVSLSISGTSVWSKEISLEGKKSKMLGIQFEKLTDQDRRLLLGYHYGYEKEQDLIWSLWDSLMGK